MEGDYVLKLNKSLYGLKQAPLTWFESLKAGLKLREFFFSKLDPCLFIHPDMILVVYVDDVLAFGTDQRKMDDIFSR